MTRRSYRLGRRAEAAAGTERRIVEATLAVHDEQGISGTSVRDIAERAGVAPSTVLRHFPVMADLVRACGALSQDLLPMPDMAVLDGASGPTERVRRMAVAMLEWWTEMGPGFDHLRVDRRSMPEVDAWMTNVEREHRSLAVAALGSGDPTRVGLLVAATTADACVALRQTGVAPEKAAAEIATLLTQDDPNMETLH